MTTKRAARKATAKKTTAKKAAAPPPDTTVVDGLRAKVEAEFDQGAMKRICEMHELDFMDLYDLKLEIVEERKTNNFYYFADHGSNILAVAHLDTVVPHSDRLTNFCETAIGPVCHSGALDDRLGAYIILELLPRLGITVDVLLSVGEESGQSTAEFFDPPEGRQYNWMIEFDRKGTDVVMYEYEDYQTKRLVEDACTGISVRSGSFSDICYLNHLKVKGFNFGTGYDGVYHSVRGYAYLRDTYKMVAGFLEFHAEHAETHLPHERKSWTKGRKGGAYGTGPKGGSGGGGWPKPGDTRWRNGRREKYMFGEWAECDYAGNILGRGQRDTSKKQKYTSEHGWVDVDDNGHIIDSPKEKSKGEPEFGDGIDDMYVHGGRRYRWSPTTGHWHDVTHKEPVRDEEEDDFDLWAGREDGEPKEHTFGSKSYRWNAKTGRYDEVTAFKKEEPAEDEGVGWANEPCTVGGKEYPSYRDWWNETHPDHQVDMDGNWIDPEGEGADLVDDMKRTTFSHGTR
jgi:hypothetical protein